MNHANAIAELSAIRDNRLTNAAIAHAEMRLHDRDADLDYANSLSETIRHLQGIVEPVLPGLEAACKTNPLFDRALTEMKRNAWNQLAGSLVGLEEVHAAGPQVSFVPVLEPAPKQPDLVISGWFHEADMEFVEDTSLTKSDSRFAGYVKATAHIYLDKPDSGTTVPA